MSMNYSYYVGPYLKCDFHYKEKEVEAYGCSKCGTTGYTQHTRAKYCEACGTLFGEYKKTEKCKSANIYDLYESINDTLSGTGEAEYDGYEILKPNICDTPRDFQIYNEDDTQEITINMIAQEISWISDTFSKEIKILKKHYDNVTIKWGCVVSYS